MSPSRTLFARSLPPSLARSLTVVLVCEQSFNKLVEGELLLVET